MTEIVQIGLPDQVVCTCELLLAGLIDVRVRALVAGLQDNIASLLNQDHAVVDQVAQFDNLFFL